MQVSQGRDDCLSGSRLHWIPRQGYLPRRAEKEEALPQHNDPPLLPILTFTKIITITVVDILSIAMTCIIIVSIDIHISDAIRRENSAPSSKLLL